MRTVHEKRRDHMCRYCSAAFQTASYLRTHVRTVHEKRRDHVCRYCSAAFGEKGHLRTHVRTVHEKRRDHVCRYCPAAFGEAGTLRKHMRSKHPDDIPPECPICFKLLAGSATATTPCGHLFCRSCIELALKITSECPSCSQACTAEDLSVQCAQ